MDQPTNPAPAQPAPEQPVPAAPPAAPVPVAPAPMPAPTPQPITPPPPTAPGTLPPAPPKSSSPWPWIIGGCLVILFLIVMVFLVFGWWVVREAKQGINERVDRYQPTMDGLKDNIDRMNKEGEEWQKKSEEYRNGMPNPEDLQQEMQNSYPSPSKSKSK